MKFGGTSLATIEHIKNASKKVEKASKESKVIVVLSAMAGITNSLVEQLEEHIFSPSKNYFINLIMHKILMEVFCDDVVLQQDIQCCIIDIVANSNRVKFFCIK